MKSRRISFLSVLLVLTFAFIIDVNLTNAQSTQSNKKQIMKSQMAKGKTVVKVINEDNDTSIFAVLLKKSGFSQVLKKKGPYTVLAPNNEALKSDIQIGKLEKNPKRLQKVVQNHLYKGDLSEKKVESALGVKIIESHDASNGVVYIINSVVKNS